ncbi:hypothetical protein Tco_1390482, partial [Tanacetum coccineum]
MKLEAELRKTEPLARPSDISIDLYKATHEAGAATTIINMRKTQVDDFSDLKISARLGEVCFTTAREYDRALYGCSW